MPTQLMQISRQISAHCADAKVGDRVFIPIIATDSVINQVRSQLIEAYPGVAIVLFRPNRSF